MAGFIARLATQLTPRRGVAHRSAFSGFGYSGEVLRSNENDQAKA